VCVCVCVCVCVVEWRSGRGKLGLELTARSTRVTEGQGKKQQTACKANKTYSIWALRKSADVL
jgi:hypothetical protein